MSTAAVGTLVVRLAALTAEFNREIEKSSKKVQSISVAAASVAKKSAAAFAGVSGAIAVITKFASEQLKVERQLAGAFRATGKSLDMERFKAFAAALQGVTTTGDETVLGLGAMLGSMGLAQAQIEAIIPGVLDLQASTGKAADTIAQQLARAIVDGSANLERYGIFMTDAEKETFELGSAAERTAFLVRKLGSFHGAAAAEASTAAGSFMQLTNSLGDVLEEFGAWLDAPLAAFFNGLRGAVDGVVAAMSKLSPQTKEWAAGITLGGTAVLGLVSALASVIAFKAPLLKMFAALKGALAITFASVLPVIAAVAVAIVGIIAAVGALRLVWDQNAVEIKETFKRLGQAVVQIWDKAIGFLTESFRKFNDWFSEKAIIIVGLFSGMSADEIGQLTMTARAGGGLLNTGEGSGARDMFAGIGDWVRRDVGASFDALKQSWNAGVRTFQDLGGAAFDAAKGLLGVEDAAKGVAGSGGGAGAPLGAESALGASNRLDAALAASGSPRSRARVGVGAGAPDPAIAAAVGLKETAARFGITISTETAMAAQSIASSLAEGTASFGSSFGSTLLGASGEIGGIVNSAMQGFASGGPMGAIGAVFAELLSRSQGFQDILAAGMESLGELVEAFEPLASALKPLAGLVFTVVGIVAQQLKPVFEAIGPVFGTVFDILRHALIAVLTIVKVLGDAWNGIVDGLESIIDSIPGVDVSLDSWKINMNGMNRTLHDLATATASRARDEVNEAAARQRATEETSGMADTMRELNQQLSNVPAGFRIDLRRYQSSTGETMTPDFGGGGGRGAVVFNIEALDLHEAARKLREIQEFRDLAEGAQETRRRPFAVPREGG